MNGVDDHAGKHRFFHSHILIEVQHRPWLVLVAAGIRQRFLAEHPAALGPLIERVLIVTGILKIVVKINFFIKRKIAQLVMTPFDQAAAA